MGAKLLVSPYDLVRPTIILWLILLILYPLAYRLVGNWDWAGVLLTIFVFGFYFNQTDFINVSILLAIAITSLLTYIRFKKLRFRAYQLSVALTLFSSFLVAIQLVVVLLLLSSIPRSYYATMASRNGELPLLTSLSVPSVKPDIYYIVLDGYPRADILKDVYDYDNSGFIKYLEGLRFVIPEKARSNYPRTALSISSTLDMQYWDTISPDLQKENVRFWWLTKPVFDHSRTRILLESIGYRSVSIATDWEITNNITTDYYFKPYPFSLNDFENFFLSSVPLRILYSPFQKVAPIITADVHRNYILYNLETLKMIPDISGPKFVFSHIIVPHPPFVFDVDGTPIKSNVGFTFDSPDGTLFSKDEYRRKYIGQIEFINREIISVVETILKRSPTPPIIVLQADHGSALYVDFMSVDTSCLKERFSIFGAYYLPGKQSVIPQDITPVNLFRIIFNEYFGMHLDLLDNRQYFTAGTNLFELQDVTDRVGNACEIK